MLAYKRGERGWVLHIGFTAQPRMVDMRIADALVTF